MMNYRDSSRQTLQRIADALATDVAVFSDAAVGERHDVRETLELLAAFARIADAKDRRACVDFVRALATRQRAS
ncbi:hypothetical protein [Methylobacterium longum]|uniref:XRE family transcriptional regulator n=1 Tax=Methylobacterium longum TaxID=767694 RepID=A0ABT8AZ86_9HYPH|nr:hypothetical protein [Methylobacterium longum]MDN3574741.1 hypothetical protein [Methylobacterium longum]